MTALQVKDEQLTASESISKVRVTSVKRIVIERIRSITVIRNDMAEYTIETTVDFESFRKSFPSAKFVWFGEHREWRLFESVGQLKSATIRIRD